jgi:hypothetical protein
MWNNFLLLLLMSATLIAIQLWSLFIGFSLAYLIWGILNCRATLPHVQFWINFVAHTQRSNPSVVVNSAPPRERRRLSADCVLKFHINHLRVFWIYIFSNHLSGTRRIFYPNFWRFLCVGWRKIGKQMVSVENYIGFCLELLCHHQRHKTHYECRLEKC